MIVVKIFGGLGNQMFQYAAGRRLAHILGTTLKLDVTWFELNSERKYSLCHFNIQENFASTEEIAKYTKYRRGRFVSFISSIIGKKSNYVSEKHFYFDPYILNLQDMAYLNGYWQSEKYFIDIEDIIREELTVKSPISMEVRLFLEEISSTESVSLHIRRGDYVANQDANIHMPCGMDYYDKCIKYINTKVERSKYFIFSDDQEWVRCHFNLLHTHNMEYKETPSSGYEDLYLMSHCKHNIIANSTFSWWGAWLNPEKKHIVCAPKQWFSKNRKQKMKIDDLIPDNWSLF